MHLCGASFYEVPDAAAPFFADVFVVRSTVNLARREVFTIIAILSLSTANGFAREKAELTTDGWELSRFARILIAHCDDLS